MARIDPFEKTIVQHLRLMLHNKKLKIDDVMEWSSHEPTVDRNIQTTEVKVALPLLGVWCAVSKNADKRPNSTSNGK